MTPLESPIEWRFAAAMRADARSFFMLQIPPCDIAEFLSRWAADRSHLYAGAPQVECGAYRVDFLFTGFSAELAPTLVAVECDGHDFHERTKEQAARDKARDRDLAHMGIQVLRFTGSEIHRDAARCVQEVIRLLDRNSDQAMQFCYPELMAKIAAEALA